MWKLVPIRPNRKLRQIENSEDIFDQFFDNFFNEEAFASLSKMENVVTNFAVDVIDAGDKYIMYADLAGFKKEDVKLEYINNYLIITACRNQSEEIAEEVNYIRKERCTGSVKRSFYIDDIKIDTIAASFENGVLRVTLDKKPLQKKVAKIMIK